MYRRDAIYRVYPVASITVWYIDINNSMDMVWHYHKFVQFYEQEMFGDDEIHRVWLRTVRNAS